MEAQQLKDQLLRAEGYAEGFKMGYAACAEFVAREMNKNGAKNNIGTPEVEQVKT